MTDRQRAFISALTFVQKHGIFFDYRRISVRRLPDERRRYEFKGTWKENLISIEDDRHNRVKDRKFYPKPWGVKLDWQGEKANVDIEFKSPEGSAIFGEDGEDFKYTGTFSSPDKVEIIDYSQNYSKYNYRVIL